MLIVLLIFSHLSFSQTADVNTRLMLLEKSMKELQDKVHRLEGTVAQKPGGTTFFTCYIETPFSGTFSSTDVTEDAARFAAVEKCAATLNGNNFACDRRRAKCSSSGSGEGSGTQK